MDSLSFIQSLQSLKSNGHLITTAYLDLSTPQKMRNAETIINNLYRYKKEKTFFKNLSELELQSVEKDIEGIVKYIRNQISMKHRSLLIVSSSEAYIWHVIPLGLEVENMLVIQDRAYLRPLLQAMSEQRNYAIALVDQGKAKIIEKRLGRAEELWSTMNLLPENRNESGYRGNEERKNQRKVEEAVSRHYKMVVSQLLDLHKKNRFNWLILGGIKEAVAEFRNLLPTELSALVFGEYQIDPNESLDKVLDRVSDSEETHRILWEKQLLRRLENEFHKTHKAVLGMKHTEEALTNGQVETLLLSENFHRKGWYCTWCGYITMDDESNCPNCQHEMTRTVDISDDLAHSALDIGARIEYVAANMGEYSPVAAILRYPK